MYFKKIINNWSIIIWIIFFSITNTYADNNIIPSIFKNNQDKYYLLNNNVMTLYINIYNSNIEHILLKKYFTNNNYNQHKKLFTKQKKYNYFTKTNFLLYNKNNNDNNIITIPWKITKTKTTSNHIYIYTSYTHKNIIWKRKISLTKNSYLFKIKYTIFNKSNKKRKIRIINSLIQTKDINPPQFISYFDKNKNITNIYDIYNNTLHNKINIQKIQSWISLHNNYFSSILFPIFNNNLKYINIYSKLINNNYILSYKSNYITLNPQKNTIIHTKLWTGPKIYKDLNLINKTLPNIINYGKLQFIILPIIKIFNIINHYIQNWILTSIFLIIILKTITYPIHKLQLQTIHTLNKIKPILNNIKKKYISTPNKYYYKITQIYKKNKINPIYIIIPFIIQIPTIMIIIRIINNTVEIKNFSFLWIKDLTYNDKYFILPILTSISTYLIQPQQFKTKNKYILSLIMIFIGYLMNKLPCGVLLYYLINNIIILLQQNFFYI